jgi:chromosome segregation ATPase
MTTSLLVRRSVTIVGVALAIIVGFGTIRVAAAWTAASAPLVVAPTTAASLQDRLADEQTRSAALTDQLTALAAQAGDLATALEQAQARIATDTRHATTLAAQLKAAKRRLATLETAVAQARRSLTRSTTGTSTSAAAPPPRVGEHDDEHEDGGG